jgi:hypothetical protein
LETAQDVKLLLSDFDTLTGAEQANRRLSTAEKIFPLAFGEDASVSTDTEFLERNSTTWQATDNNG